MSAQVVEARYRVSENTAVIDANLSFSPSWDRFMEITTQKPIIIEELVISCDDEKQAADLAYGFCTRTGAKITKVFKVNYTTTKGITNSLPNSEIGYLNAELEKNMEKHILLVTLSSEIRQSIFDICNQFLPETNDVATAMDILAEDITTTLEIIHRNISDSIRNGIRIPLYSDGSALRLNRNNRKSDSTQEFIAAIKTSRRSNARNHAPKFASLVMGVHDEQAKEKDNANLKDFYAARQNNREDIYDFYLEMLKILDEKTASKLDTFDVEMRNYSDITDKIPILRQEFNIPDKWNNSEETYRNSADYITYMQMLSKFKDKHRHVTDTLLDIESRIGGLVMWFATLFDDPKNSRHYDFIETWDVFFAKKFAASYAHEKERFNESNKAKYSDEEIAFQDMMTNFKTSGRLKYAEPIPAQIAFNSARVKIERMTKQRDEEDAKNTEHRNKRLEQLRRENDEFLRGLADRERQQKQEQTRESRDKPPIPAVPPLPPPPETPVASSTTSTPARQPSKQPQPTNESPGDESTFDF